MDGIDNVVDVVLVGVEPMEKYVTLLGFDKNKSQQQTFQSKTSYSSLNVIETKSFIF